MSGDEFRVTHFCGIFLNRVDGTNIFILLKMFESFRMRITIFLSLLVLTGALPVLPVLPVIPVIPGQPVLPGPQGHSPTGASRGRNLNFTSTVYTTKDITETSCFYVDNLSLNIMVVNGVEGVKGVKYMELSFNERFNLTFHELTCTQTWPAVCNLTCADASRYYIELVLENTTVQIFYALPTGKGFSTFSFGLGETSGHAGHNYVRRTPNSLSFTWPRSPVNSATLGNPVSAEQPAFIFIFCIVLGVVLGLLIFVFLKRRRRNPEPLLPV